MQKKKAKLKHRKITPKNYYLYKHLKRANALKKSFYINKYFWITYLLCIIILSTKYGIHKSTMTNIYIGILFSIIAIANSWLIHFLSHNIDLERIFLELLSKYNIKLNNYLHKAIILIIRYTYDFHDKIHHNSTINKKWYNIIIEFCQNVLQVLTIVGVAKLLHYKIDNTVLFLWGLIYATVHQINYEIIDNRHHKEHHMNNHTNYGIDTADIMFNSKYNLNDVEDMNHASINIVLSTLFIIGIKHYDALQKAIK
jgi:hypothetical protein